MFITVPTIRLFQDQEGGKRATEGVRGGLSECSRGGQACNLTVVGRSVGRGKTVH